MKAIFTTYLFLALGLATAGVVRSQQVGTDSFSARPALVLGSGAAIGAGSNATATAESGEPAHAGAAAAKSLWWRYTPTSGGVVQVDTIGSTFDTRLSVYTGSSLSGLQRVAANFIDSDAPNLDCVVRFFAQAGVLYSIAVDGYTDAANVTETGTVSLNLTHPASGPAPANDNFLNATVLPSTESAAASGDTSLASVEAGEPDAETTLFTHIGPGRSVWYSWTPLIGFTGGYMTVTVDASAANWEPVLGVYEGFTLANLSTGEKDRGESLAFYPNAADATRVTATFLAQPAHSYRILVAGKSHLDYDPNDPTLANHGSFDLTLQPATRPANDDFVNATDLGNATTSAAQGSLFESTRQPNEPNQFAPLGYSTPFSSSSIWWKWTAPSTGPVTVDTRGSDGDTVLVVYHPAGIPATLLNLQMDDSNDDISYDDGQYASVVTFNATSGQLYYFSVSGYALSSAVYVHLATGAAKTPYEAWLLGFPTLTGAAAAKTADPDGDGLINEMEMALGTDPTVNSYALTSDLALIPLFDRDPNNNNLPTLEAGYASWNLFGIGAGTPVTMTAEWTSDLTTWTAAPAANVSLGIVSISATLPLTSGSLKFLRYKVVDTNP